MKVVGLITEYNPFHNGHLYHIEQAKKITGAERVIVVMSGDYVQRGEPAIMPKHLRTKIALECGASAVFELPVRYATGSAESFAAGAIELLDKLHIVDSVCFGSECADLEQLKTIAEILVEEPSVYLEALKKDLQKGISYPAARAHAIGYYTGRQDDSNILNQPNNILGIEYLKALIRRSSNIQPFTLKRDGADYHDKEIRTHHSSASAIRLHLTKLEGNVLTNSSPLFSQTPPKSHIDLTEEYHISYPVYLDTFSLILKYTLLTNHSFDQFQDVSIELSNRIIRERNHFQSFTQFCNLLKTKELTYTRISRALLHIMLQITKNDPKNPLIYYAHLLGFRSDEADVLTQAKQHALIPIITKLASVSFESDKANTMFHTDCFASDLYQSVITELYKTPFVNELQKQIVRI